MRLELHCSKIAQHPGRGRGEPGHRSRIYEPSLAALHVRDLLNRCLVRMAAAHEVPVPGARHCVAVLRIMHDEDAPSPELEARVWTVVLQLPATVACPARQRDRVA